MKKNLLSIVLCFFVFSCKKEVSEINKAETTPYIKIQEAKDFLINLPSLKTNSQNQSIFDAKSLLEEIDWKNASLADSGNVLIGKFEGQPSENGTKLGFRKAIFYKDKSGKLILNILEFIPEIYHLWKYKGINGKIYDGKIMIYNSNYKLIQGYCYAQGKIIGNILPKLNSSNQSINSNVKTQSVSCIGSTYAYLNAQGTYEAGILYSCETRYYFSLIPNDPGLINQNVTEDLLYAGLNGGGITQIISTPIPNLYIPGQDNAPIDVKKFIKCFGTTHDLHDSYKFSVYVDQPINGSTASSSAGNVGHAFIGITKTTSIGSFTQYIGFYPENNYSGFLPFGSKFVDNSQYSYDVSISFNIPYSDFSYLLEELKGYNQNYNVWTNNCTNFVLQMADAANVYVPNTGGNSVISKTPGQLGEDLRIYKRIWGTGIGVNDNGGTTGNSKRECN